MKQIFIIIFALIISLFSCKTSKKTTEAAAPVIDTINDYSFRKAVKDKELFSSATDAVPLDTIYLSKDTLHILTKKILGCDEENFTLLWNGLVMKSFPPQTSVKLFQRVDPACKERHHFHLTYNIKALRMKDDSAQHGATIIRMSDWKGAVKYEF